MKRLILALCLLLPTAAWAQCFVSGDTTKYTHFIAVDATDKVTRETGLTSFTVYRSRNGGSNAAFTTPTVEEVNASNQPGVYRLLLDEDMTIGSGNDMEQMVLTITHAGMEPVTKEICIARPKITAGETLTVSSGSGNAAVQSVASNAITASAIADGAIDLATFAADANPLFGILRRGTAQSATSTTLVLDSGASFADDVPIGSTLVACGSTQGYCQSRLVTDYTGSSDTATVSAWPVTPSGTITYYVFASAPGEGGSGGGLDAEGIRDAIGLASANLDTQLSTIDGNVDSILADTGTDGVVVASGSKTGYSIGSGGITSSSFASGAITAASIATDAIGAAELASDAVTEIQSGLATSSALSTVAGYVDTEVAAIKAVTDLLPDAGALTSLATASAIATVDGVVDAIKLTTDKLDDTLEDNSGTYRFTEAALAQAPAGEGGGGGTDWDADERTAIRAILGVPVSGSTPADPSSGILDTIRDAVATRASQTSVDDLPTNAELASALASADDAVLSAIGGLNDISAEDVWNVVIEDQGGGVIARCAMSVALSYAAGDVTTTGQSSTYRDPSGAETRIAGTVSSNGNRAVSITCPTY